MDFYGLGRVCFLESHVADFRSKNIPPGLQRTRGTIFPFTLQYTTPKEDGDNAVRPKGSFLHMECWYAHLAAKELDEAKEKEEGDEDY